ncbi:MAG: YfhO family protein, partial [Bacteroidota bacterium]
NAMGNCWFVNEAKWVNGPVEEMKAISLPDEDKIVSNEIFNPKQEAVIDKVFKSAITEFSPADSTDVIKMTQFDNDAIKYESNTRGNRLAVFSEIYYKDWNAYIDGKKTPIAKANYVLRAMVIPSGQHKIEFKFEPKSFYIGRTVSAFASWLAFLMALGGIIYYLLDNLQIVKPWRVSYPKTEKKDP